MGVFEICSIFTAQAGLLELTAVLPLPPSECWWVGMRHGSQRMLFVWGLLSFAQHHIYDLHQYSHVVCSVTLSQGSAKLPPGPVQPQAKNDFDVFFQGLQQSYRRVLNRDHIWPVKPGAFLYLPFRPPPPTPCLPTLALWYFFGWMYNLLIPCSIYRLFPVLSYDRQCYYEHSYRHFWWT